MIRSWMTLFAMILAALCGPLASPVAGQAPNNSYTAVQLSSTQTVAFGINDAGQVVGQSPLPHDLYLTRPFLWQNGVRTDLGTLEGGVEAAAFGINNSGQVVGYSDLVQGGTRTHHAVLWQNGAVIELGTLPGGGAATPSTALGINDAGQVVGLAYLLLSDGTYKYHAFLWDSATGMHDLGTLGGPQSLAYAVNGAGQVVGEAQAADGAYYPFRWTPSAANATTGTMAALGTFSGVARDINDSGEVVGSANGQPVRWDKSGVAHSLAALPGFGPGSGRGYYSSYDPGYGSGLAYAINNAGEIVGDCSYSDSISDPEGYNLPITFFAAVVWDSAGAVRDLNALTSSDGLMHAVGINDSGQVMANSFLLSFLLNPSPPQPFRRGDANADGTLDLTDVVFTLYHHFLGGPAPSCLKTADVDGTGVLDLSDAIYSLTYQFLGGPAPVKPFPECGIDSVSVQLTCESFAGCVSTK